MNKKLHVRRNDVVEVIAGDGKGRRGRVLAAYPALGRVLVEGVNMVWKHLRRTPQNPRGGRTEREAPLDASNVMLLCQNRDCAKHDAAVRTRILIKDDGSKQRVCGRCGKPIVTPE